MRPPGSEFGRTWAPRSTDAKAVPKKEMSPQTKLRVHLDQLRITHPRFNAESQALYSERIAETISIAHDLPYIEAVMIADKWLWKPINCKNTRTEHYSKESPEQNL